MNGGNTLKARIYPQDIPVMGIDVSKEKSDFCVLDVSNKVVKRGIVHHTPDSITDFLEKLSKISTALDARPVCVMEATAHYHRILYKQLVDNGYTVMVINPIQSGSIKNVDIRNIKNDKVDAYRLAYLYRLGKLKASNIPEGELSQLRSLCRFHITLTDDIAEHIIRLRSYTDQSFPGFEDVFSKLKGKTPLAVLEKYPTPKAILNADEKELVQLLSSASRKGMRYAEPRVAKLKATAEAALKIGLDRPEDEILIPAEIAIIHQLQDNLYRVDKEIAEVVKGSEMLTEQVELLKSIPGIGENSATALIAEIGDISLFSNAKQLTAYFGLEPSQRQSGKFTGTKTKLSKRGSSYLRRVINMVAFKCAFKQRNGTFINPVLAEYYERMCEKKEKKTALCAVMRKLVHIVFAVLRDQKPFEFRTPEEHEQLIRAKNLECRMSA